MKTPFASTLLGVVFFLAFAAPAPAAPELVPGEIRIGNVVGTVTVIREGETTTDLREEDVKLGRKRPQVAVGARTKAEEGYILRQGEAIETGADSKAVLVFSNGTVLGVEPNTYLSINAFLQEPFNPNSYNIKSAPTEPSISKTHITLKKGEILGDVRKLNRGSTMDYTTPVGTAGIRGTRFKLTIASISADGRTFTASLSVDSGSVAFTPTGATRPTATVTSGNFLRLTWTFGTPITGALQPGPLSEAAKQELVAQFQQLMSSFSYTTESGTPSTTTSIPLDLDTGDQGATNVGTLQGGSGSASNTGGSGATGGGGGGAQNPPGIYSTQ
jgi:hypothetical protein